VSVSHKSLSRRKRLAGENRPKEGGTHPSGKKNASGKMAEGVAEKEEKTERV